MRVLFISGELIAGDVAYQLVREGCDVKLYIQDKSRRECFDKMVKQTDDWGKELKWVGKDGIIVFDDTGHGKIADRLRNEGYSVFGGGVKGDKLEKNREEAQKIFKEYGLTTEESCDFYSSKAAIAHIKKHPSAWVVKQNGHKSSLAYVGQMNDGQDAISVLKCYEKYNREDAINVISLQKRVEGIEMAVGRFFNGKEWVGPICVNFEHKPFFPGDIGPLTAEMGTLAWYDNDEKQQLFLDTLNRLTPYLRDIDYRGYADINCIVSENRAVVLEATMRFGSPLNHLQSEMQITPWRDILEAVAKGRQCEVKYKKGYSLVVSLAVPPFPYTGVSSSYHLHGVDILFKRKLSTEEKNRIHFEEVSLRSKKAGGEYYIAGPNGYVLFVTGTGETVSGAREQAYSVIKEVVIPKVMYRNDIGVKFELEQSSLLKKWGWI